MPEINLWPDFDKVQASRSPKAVIEEAGGGLHVKTNGVVRFYPLSTSIKDEKGEVVYSLYTQLLRYHFPFLRATFALEPAYPVTISPTKCPTLQQMTKTS